MFVQSIDYQNLELTFPRYYFIYGPTRGSLQTGTNVRLTCQVVEAFAGICRLVLCTHIYSDGWLNLEDKFVTPLQTKSEVQGRNHICSCEVCCYETELTVARGSHRVALSRNCHSNWFEQLVYSCSCSEIWKGLGTVRQLEHQEGRKPQDEHNELIKVVYLDVNIMYTLLFP